MTSGEGTPWLSSIETKPERARWKGWRMATHREIRTERLYVKAPGTHQLRKTAAGSLRHLLANGWHETERRVRSDHVEIRLERNIPGPSPTHHPYAHVEEPGGPRPPRERRGPRGR